MKWLATVVAVEEVVTVVGAGAEVGVEVSLALMPHLWVEVDAGKCLPCRRPLRYPLSRHGILCGISSACRLS